MPAETGGGDSNVDPLRAHLAEAEAERNALRVARQRRATTATHHGVAWDPNAPIPPMPEDEQELYDWLQDRHTDLKDVLEFGARNEILQLTSTVAEGAARLSELTDMALSGSPPGGEGRGRTRSGARNVRPGARNHVTT